MDSSGKIRYIKSMSKMTFIWGDRQFHMVTDINMFILSTDVINILTPKNTCVNELTPRNHTQGVDMGC